VNPDFPRVRRPTTRGGVCALAAVVTLALGLPAPASADVAFSGGWMRPAHAGDKTAEAYVDVDPGDSPMVLVGVTTPLAKSVELVAGEVRDKTYRTHTVRRFELPAGSIFRFARYGNVLRLHDIVSDTHTGDSVHLEFTLRDPQGRSHSAGADIVVRGLTLP